MAITEYVFKGSDNPVDVTVQSTQSGVPLSGVTRMTCELVEARVTYDSDVIATDITWSDTKFTLNLNDKNVSGTQRTIIKAYDSGHPDGQTIAHPEGPTPGQLTLKFVEP